MKIAVLRKKTCWIDSHSGRCSRSRYLDPIGTICLYLNALNFEIHTLCPRFPENLYNPSFWILFIIPKFHYFTWYSDIGNFRFLGVSIGLRLELGWWALYFSFQALKIYSFDF